MLLWPTSIAFQDKNCVNKRGLKSKCSIKVTLFTFLHQVPLKRKLSSCRLHSVHPRCKFIKCADINDGIVGIVLPHLLLNF